MSEPLQVVCPCCGSRLTVDAATGAVLTHRRVRKGHARSLHQAIADLEGEAKEREEAFARALKQETGEREDLLMKKLQAARKQARDRE